MIITCQAHTNGATHEVKLGVDIVRKLVDVYQEGYGHTVKRVDGSSVAIMPICVTGLVKQINETRDESETVASGGKASGRD